MNDANYLGFVFESLVIRDLRIYAEAMDGNVFFFKDSNGYDVDAIVELPDGSWSAFEIKLGSYDGIEAGVENVKKIKDKVADRNKNNLKSLNIITIGTGSYTRDDGINIIELGNLYIN
jgi:predicted AAA+ superfamily ATPase